MILLLKIIILILKSKGVWLYDGKEGSPLGNKKTKGSAYNI
jgi:hypothetical protein